MSQVYTLHIDRRPFYTDIPEGPLTWCYKHPGRMLKWTSHNREVQIYCKDKTKWYSEIYVRDPDYISDCVIAYFRKHEIE